MDSFGFDKKSNNIFFEEKENLDNNMQKIDAKIKKLNEDAIKYRKDCENNRGDYEYLNEFRRCQAYYMDALNDLRKTEKLSFSPYFGHMYLESNENDEDIFVGKESISTIDGKNIVYDWRSPVCSLFYANQDSIKYNNYEYKAEYKRQIEIKNKKLIKCYESYNNKNNQVTDSFLKEVLKSKKNIDGFTDIIKTIQSKQNEIIRLSLDKNIICQGVAGSGKTVIMIHRLSYLLYNNKNINPKNFLFIAPSDNFKKQLNELNVELGIDKIKLLTLYEYYMEKFNTYLNMFSNKKYYIKEIVDDDNIDIRYNYSKEGLLKKYEIIENLFSKEVNKIIDKYNINIKKENQTYFSISKQVNEFLVSRTKKYLELQTNLNNDIHILKSFARKYDGFVLDLKKEINVDKIESNQIASYKHEIHRLENDNSKIKNSFFTLFRRGSYKKNLTEINRLNKIVNVCHIDTFRKEFNTLNKYISITSNFRKGIDDFLVFLESYIESTNTNLDDFDQIIECIVNINKNLKMLCKFNYEEDCYNINILREFVTPRNIIEACFEKICIGDYKLNTVFSNKQYYRNDIFSIIYILGAMGFRLSEQYKYIYIDESQDYNDEEIKLIKKLESNSVLNIFGDFDQNISSNSQLRQNWNSLKKIFNNNYNYYELNENYRNTINVVDYCNKELKTNMFGIGVEGDNVKLNKFVSIEDVIKRAELTESIIITKNEKYLEYINNNSNVPCFDIKSVKGLEFKNVIVIDDGLTKNERYVSFTRSLNNLEIYTP